MKVHRLDASFPFEQLEPSVPRPLQGGGAFHSSLHREGSAVHFQLPECSTKAGVVVSSRGGHVDLVYPADKHDGLLGAIERLEQSICKIVGGKKELWFTNEVADEDIEAMTIPLVRPYRGGRSFTIRISIPKSKLNAGGGFIFDERKVTINHESTDIKECRVIPLVTLEGLRYTARSITIELSALQLMVLDEPMSGECFIATGSPKAPSPTSESLEEAEVSTDPPPSESQLEQKAGESELQEVTIKPDELGEISIRSQADVYKDLYEEAYEKAKRLKAAAIAAFARAKEIKELYSLGDDFYSESESEGEEIAVA